MSEAQFQYAVLRVVPSAERGECLNAGVILFCRERGYLAAGTALDEALLAALAPDLDVDVVRRHLAAVTRIAAGDADAGPIAGLDQAQRFHWLVSPSSTVLRPSEVHTGLCTDPADVLDRLVTRLVLRQGGGPAS